MNLQVRGLTFSYNGASTLEDVTLDVRGGEVVSLVGPNGSGKSTLLKCIDQILKPKSGAIYLDCKEAASFSSREISKVIGYVPQSNQEVFPYTVFDIVLMGRRPHLGWRVREKDLKIVAKTLRFMGIIDLQSRYFDELSGGEKQKIAMARALAQEPKVLLLDEPTSNLDIKHQLEVMKIVQKLVEENGISALMAMHDLNLASRFSDKMVMLKDRTIFTAGRPESVLIPENIEAVYGVRAIVKRGHTGKPYVMPLDPIDSLENQG